MRYKLLGRSGLRVSELALGTMTFGEDWGWGASKDESRRIFDAFVAAGGNFIDTASNYTNGTSERYVGELLGSERDRFVVATKYTLSFRPGDPNAGGNSRKSMVRSVERSLTHLRTDYIDLLWVHAWDGMTPVDEILRGLDDLVRQGKVLYVGFSDTPAWVVSRADMMAELHGWSRVTALQIPYSLARRDAERDLLPMARALDLAVTPWGLLSGGVLTGKYRVDGDEPTRMERDAIRQDALEMGDTVTAIAGEIGCSPACLAVAWVRAQQDRALMIPILGVRTQAQLEDTLGCLELDLGEAQLQRLDEASAITLGFPYDFLGTENVVDLIHGGTRNLLDVHRH